MCSLLSMLTVVGWVEAPWRYILIPKPVNVTLSGNRTFEYLIKDFKTEIIMDYLGGSTIITRIILRLQKIQHNQHLNFRGFSVGSVGKESVCNAGSLNSIPELQRSREKGMATQLSILAWRIPRTEEPGHKELDTTEPLTRTSPANTLFSPVKWIWVLGFGAVRE